MLANSYHMLLKDSITVICYIINLISCVTLDNICIAMYFADDTITVAIQQEKGMRHAA